jgi:hypothetical protein
MVLDANGVVVRCGQLYGPDTFYENEVPSHPRIHVDAAAEATPPLIEAMSGVVTVAEEGITAAGTLNRRGKSHRRGHRPWARSTPD